MNPNTKKSGTSPETHEKATSPPPAFDTLQAVRKLKNAEFGEKQAVTLVETLQDAQNELATRAGLGQIEFALRSDMERTELAIRGDMERMESSIRADMGKMELRLRSDLENRFISLHRFLLIGGGVMTAILSVVITLAITLAK